MLARDASCYSAAAEEEEEKDDDEEEDIRCPIFAPPYLCCLLCMAARAGG